MIARIVNDAGKLLHLSVGAQPVEHAEREVVVVVVVAENRLQLGLQPSVLFLGNCSSSPSKLITGQFVNSSKPGNWIQLGLIGRCLRLSRHREDMGLARGRGPRRLASLRGPAVPTLTSGRETVAGRNGHLARIVKRSSARADLNVLARAMIVLTRLVERLVGHLGHLLTCVPSRYYGGQTRGFRNKANLCLVDADSIPHLVVDK